MRKFIPLLILAALLVTYLLRGPYFWPTSFAVGPCLKDYTSPNSYKARSSPLRETRTSMGSADILVCYGAPQARGRTLFAREDALVPWGRLWRLGANEPTRLFVSGTIVLGSLEIPAGRYSLYAIPDSSEWEVFVTSSTFHWGNQISQSVRSQELGSIRVGVERREPAEESLTISAVDSALLMQWGTTAVNIPIAEAQP